MGIANISSTAKKSIPVGSIMAAGFGYLDFSTARDEGEGIVSSLGSAALGFALPELMGVGPFVAMNLAMELPSMVVEAGQTVNKQIRDVERSMKDQRPFQTKTFIDGPQIYTMRQAGMALAKKSNYSLQQTMMGNEAEFLHR